MPSIFDHAAAAAGEALREVAWDREHGLPCSTPDMLRKVAGAVLTVAEAYGVRSCRTCRHWQHPGNESWGSCGLATDPSAQDPPRFSVIAVGAELLTHETHGCRGWQHEGDGVMG